MGMVTNLLWYAGIPTYVEPTIANHGKSDQTPIIPNPSLSEIWL